MYVRRGDHIGVARKMARSISVKEELLSMIAAHYQRRGFPRDAVEHLKRRVGEKTVSDSIVFKGVYRLNKKMQNVLEYFRGCDGRARGKITDADAIFAFSWGYRIKSCSDGGAIGRLPGRNNRQLGEIAVGLKRRLRVPLCAQFEIADAIEDSEDDRNLHPDYRTPTEDMGTSKAIEYFVGHQTVQRRHAFRSVVVVAHRHHLDRCLIILKEDFQIDGLPSPRSYDGYDRREDQLRAMNPKENIVSDFVSMAARAK